MTDVPVDDPETLRRILANTEALLLDFDGPICSVFAGFPASIVADQLRQILTESSQVELPPRVAASGDPFDVLSYAATLGTDVARYVEAAFRAHELEAISTATPTPAAHDLIIKWNKSNRPLAIVSNNSIVAIETYLKIYRLKQFVEYISARSSSDVALLKPNPYLIDRAVTVLGVAATEVAFIGDSKTDIKAAKAANVKIIGYANKPWKYNQFAALQADALTSSIATILDNVHCPQ
jgi:phosphoglycolate phosphatase